MLTLVIDPGRTSGMMHVSPDLKVVKAMLATELGAFLSMFHEPYLTNVVIEDFVGAGPRSSDAIFTLKLIGSAEATAFLLKLPYMLHVPQTRIPYLADSKRALVNFPTHSPHFIDCYAHALAFYERKEYVAS